MSKLLGYRPDIDGLRAVSVVVVMLFHLGFAPISGGFVGVDVFFVISGYLITSIIAREIDAGVFTFAGFYERRIRRIYPALIVVLVATFLGAYLVVMPRDFLAFSRTLIAAPLFAANFMFLGGDGYFDPGATTKPLLHTWSLGVEEQFYIVLPWLLMWASRNERRAKRTAIVAAVVAASYAASVIGGLLTWRQSYFLLPTRFFELGIGALVALARPQLSQAVRSILGIAGLAAIVAACFLVDETMAFPGWVAVVPCLGAAGVILGEGGPAARLLATRPMVFVGRISYPMYLWHWPPIVFTLYVTGKPIDLSTGAALFAFTVAASAATLWVIETPIRSRRLFAGRTGLFAASAALSAVIVVLGIVGMKTRGWPSRLAPDVAALAKVAAEGTTIERKCPHGRRDMSKDLPPCVIGDTSRSKFDFVILGDSHSRALSGEIGEAAKRVGLKGLYLGRVACPPLVGVERLGDSTRRCGEHIAWALGRIGEIDPPAVVMIGRWGGLAGPVDEIAERLDPVRWGWQGKVVTRVDAEAAIRAGFAGTLDALAGRRVVVLFSVPEPGYDVPMVQAAAHLALLDSQAERPHGAGHELARIGKALRVERARV
jgi:peptidoglycan/LPS O-acetylase OafA/YrhL